MSHPDISVKGHKIRNFQWGERERNDWEWWIGISFISPHNGMIPKGISNIIHCGLCLTIWQVNEEVPLDIVSCPEDLMSMNLLTTILTGHWIAVWYLGDILKKKEEEKGGKGNVKESVKLGGNNFINWKQLTSSLPLCLSMSSLDGFIAITCAARQIISKLCSIVVSRNWREMKWKRRLIFQS